MEHSHPKSWKEEIQGTVVQTSSGIYVASESQTQSIRKAAIDFLEFYRETEDGSDPYLFQVMFSKVKHLLGHQAWELDKSNITSSLELLQETVIQETEEEREKLESFRVKRDTSYITSYLSFLSDKKADFVKMEEKWGLSFIDEQKFRFYFVDKEKYKAEVVAINKTVIALNALVQGTSYLTERKVIQVLHDNLWPMLFYEEIFGTFLVFLEKFKPGIKSLVEIKMKRYENDAYMKDIVRKQLAQLRNNDVSMGKTEQKLQEDVVKKWLLAGAEFWGGVEVQPNIVRTVLQVAGTNEDTFRSRQNIQYLQEEKRRQGEIKRIKKQLEDAIKAKQWEIERKAQQEKEQLEEEHRKVKAAQLKQIHQELDAKRIQEATESQRLLEEKMQKIQEGQQAKLIAEQASQQRFRDQLAQQKIDSAAFAVRNSEWNALEEYFRAKDRWDAETWRQEAAAQARVQPRIEKVQKSWSQVRYNEAQKQAKEEARLTALMQNIQRASAKDAKQQLEDQIEADLQKKLQETKEIELLPLPVKSKNPGVIRSFQWVNALEWPDDSDTGNLLKRILLSSDPRTISELQQYVGALEKKVFWSSSESSKIETQPIGNLLQKIHTLSPRVHELRNWVPQPQEVPISLSDRLTGIFQHLRPEYFHSELTALSTFLVWLLLSEIGRSGVRTDDKYTPEPKSGGKWKIIIAEWKRDPIPVQARSSEPSAIPPPTSKISPVVWKAPTVDSTGSLWMRSFPPKSAILPHLLAQSPHSDNSSQWSITSEFDSQGENQSSPTKPNRTPDAPKAKTVDLHTWMTKDSIGIQKSPLFPILTPTTLTTTPSVSPVANWKVLRWKNEPVKWSTSSGTSDKWANPVQARVVPEAEPKTPVWGEKIRNRSPSQQTDAPAWKRESSQDLSVKRWATLPQAKERVSTKPSLPLDTASPWTPWAQESKKPPRTTNVSPQPLLVPSWVLNWVLPVSASVVEPPKVTAPLSWNSADSSHLERMVPSEVKNNTPPWSDLFKAVTRYESDAYVAKVFDLGKHTLFGYDGRSGSDDIDISVEVSQNKGATMYLDGGNVAIRFLQVNDTIQYQVYTRKSSINAFSIEQGLEHEYKRKGVPKQLLVQNKTVSIEKLLGAE